MQAGIRLSSERGWSVASSALLSFRPGLCCARPVSPLILICAPFRFRIGADFLREISRLECEIGDGSAE